MRKLVTVFALCALAACANDLSEDALERHKPKHPVVDASEPTPPDASGPTGTVVVACYTQTQPNYACSSPQHCCFSNYSAQHNGSCSTAECAYGTILCDGPEDCATGQHCCAQALKDPELGLLGYRLACQSQACGAAPDHEEMCHTSATCSSGSCVTAYGTNNDLPRALSICR
jgi:hypothetical protein